MARREPKVTQYTPMPKGYGFLNKGNVYRTSLCRRKTHAAGKTLYVVSKGNTQLGLRAPKWIINEVMNQDRATKEIRKAAVQRRDEAAQDEFRDAIRRVFPQIPEKALEDVVTRALKKRSGRVGRTGLLEVGEKARLAVAAHVRHRHTDYESLLKKGKPKEEARREVHRQILNILKEWGGGRGLITSTRKRKNRGGRIAPEAKRRRKETEPKSIVSQLGQKQAAESATIQKSEPKQQPGKTKRTSMPTRSSTRFGSTGLQDLEMLDNFFDGSDSHRREEKSEEEYATEMEGVVRDGPDAWSDDFVLDDTDGGDTDMDWLSE